MKYSPLERRGDVGADNCSGSPSSSVDMVTCSRGTKMKSGITGNDPVGRKCARAFTRVDANHVNWRKRDVPTNLWCVLGERAYWRTRVRPNWPAAKRMILTQL